MKKSAFSVSNSCDTSGSETCCSCKINFIKNRKKIQGLESVLKSSSFMVCMPVIIQYRLQPDLLIHEDCIKIIKYF